MVKVRVRPGLSVVVEFKFRLLSRQVMTVAGIDEGMTITLSFDTAQNNLKLSDGTYTVRKMESRKNGIMESRCSFELLWISNRL